MGDFNMPKMIGPADRKPTEPMKSDLDGLRRSMDFAATASKNISIKSAELEKYLRKMHGNPNAINQATLMVSELEREVQVLREFLVIL